MQLCLCRGEDAKKSYVLGEQLGTGETGIVYSGKSGDGQTVACKVAFPKSEQEYEVIAKESKIHQQLSHPHIVDFHGFVEDYVWKNWVMRNRRTMLIMEFMSGGTLKKRLQLDPDSPHKCTDLTELQAVEYLRQIVEGVAYLHSKRIIHRNLKSTDVMIGSDGRLKIIDFGSAAELVGDRRIFREEAVHGTSAYIAPEVWNFLYSPECDVFMVGCLAYELLYGVTPLVWVSKRLQDMLRELEKCYCQEERDECYRTATEEMKDHIEHLVFEFHPRRSMGAPSSEYQDLVKQLMSYGPALRPLSSQILNHPLFAKHGVSAESLPETMDLSSPDITSCASPVQMDKASNSNSNGLLESNSKESNSNGQIEPHSSEKLESNSNGLLESNSKESNPNGQKEPHSSEKLESNSNSQLDPQSNEKLAPNSNGQLEPNSNGLAESKTS
jgi:serine/threonine protein kinase